MKKLLTSTALTFALTAPGWAQSTQTEVGLTQMTPDSLLVGEMIGEPVYNFRGVPNNDKPMPVDGAERFEKIATVKDVLINADGEVQALVMSVGGFWGLADREVTASMDGVTIVTDTRGDKYIVIFTDEETLDDAARFDKFKVVNASSEDESEADGAEEDAETSAEEGDTEDAGGDSAQEDAEAPAEDGDTEAVEDAEGGGAEEAAEEDAEAPAEEGDTEAVEDAGDGGSEEAAEEDAETPAEEGDAEAAEDAGQDGAQEGNAEDSASQTEAEPVNVSDEDAEAPGEGDDMGADAEIGQDADAQIDKAKPADEMQGEVSPNGTALDANEEEATVDGRPRDAQKSDVNTETDEAEVGIPEQEDGAKTAD